MFSDYHGFEEYDGGRLSRVGRQTPAVMVPPGWPDPPEKKGNSLEILKALIFISGVVFACKNFTIYNYPHFS